MSLIISVVWKEFQSGIRMHSNGELKREWPPVKGSIKILGIVLLEDKGEQNVDGSLKTRIPVFGISCTLKRPHGTTN